MSYDKFEVHNPLHNPNADFTLTVRVGIEVTSPEYDSITITPGILSARSYVFVDNTMVINIPLENLTQERVYLSFAGRVNASITRRTVLKYIQDCLEDDVDYIGRYPFKCYEDAAKYIYTCAISMLYALDLHGDKPYTYPFLVGFGEFADRMYYFTHTLSAHEVDVIHDSVDQLWRLIKSEEIVSLNPNFEIKSVAELVDRVQDYAMHNKCPTLFEVAHKLEEYHGL